MGALRSKNTDSDTGSRFDLTGVLAQRDKANEILADLARNEKPSFLEQVNNEIKAHPINKTTTRA